MIPYDVDLVRKDFPILSREVNGTPLIYLDNGASAQKPRCVIDAVTQAYSMEYANVHRGLHYLSNLATDRYEAVRGKIARFLNAGSEAEIVFTSGASEANNLALFGAAEGLSPRRHLVTQATEHPSVLQPLRRLEARGWELRVIGVFPKSNAFLDEPRIAVAPQAQAIVPVRAHRRRQAVRAAGERTIDGAAAMVPQRAAAAGLPRNEKGFIFAGLQQRRLKVADFLIQDAGVSRSRDVEGGDVRQP